MQNNARLCRRACPQLIGIASLSAGTMPARIAGLSRIAWILVAQILTSAQEKEDSVSWGETGVFNLCAALSGLSLWR